jgi:cell division protein FtsB
MFKRLFDKLTYYILLVLVIVLGFTLIKNIQKLRRINNDIQHKELEVERMKRESEDLARQLEEVEKPEYIEAQIRNKLGFSKEGEIVVILPPDDVLRSLVPKPLVIEDKRREPNWRRWFELFF